MIFDLHNDLITSELTLAEKRRYLTDTVPNLKGLVVVYWMTRQKCFPRKEKLKKMKNLYCAIEDLGYIQDTDYEALRLFEPLYCSLTWNEDNRLAGGADGVGSVTPAGREVIGKLNEYGIGVDTAHLNRTSFYEVADRGEKLLNSHTCLDCIFPHPRNITDRQIKLIIEKGGIVGLTLVSGFMAKTAADANDYFMQIDTFVSKFGIDNLAIGTDFFGTDNLPEGLKNYYDFLALEYTLLNAGYKTADINRIFFENALRFFGLQAKKNRAAKA
ncbi:MAG: dipeptidase [Clostridiales bacterium]|jgi:microsomal dipeptidase-like Zn-dependent dipeptidase|nr:dipeptidase [Clostridiales bacterium]